MSTSLILSMAQVLPLASPMSTGKWLSPYSTVCCTASSITHCRGLVSVPPHHWSLLLLYFPPILMCVYVCFQVDLILRDAALDALGVSWSYTIASSLATTCVQPPANYTNVLLWTVPSNMNDSASYYLTAQASSNPLSFTNSPLFRIQRFFSSHLSCSFSSYLFSLSLSIYP